MKKAVGYLRRSTDKQETSISDQKNAISKYAQNNDYEIMNWYIDDAVSGTSTHGRKQFKQLIEDAKGKTFSAVLVWDIRRFSRGDLDEAGHYRYLLRRNGVEVVYISENLRGDDTDDLLINTKQFLARQESKDKAKDTLRGLIPKILEGHANNGIPYGYNRLLLDKDGKVKGVFKKGEVSGRKAPSDKSKLALGEPDKVKIVKRIFDMYVNGMGMRLIARKLNQEGIPSPFDKKWSMTSVDPILRNPAYTGKSVWNRSGRGKFYKVTKEKEEHTIQEKGRTVSLKHERYSEENWFVYENAHKPIISQGLFDRAQKTRQMRAHDKSFWGRGLTSPYLLTGLIKCKRCGRSLSIAIRKQPNKTYLYYTCEGCIISENPITHRIPTEKIEQHIIKKLRYSLFNAKEMQAIIDKVKEGFKAEVCDGKLTAKEIDKKLKENEQRVNLLLDNIDPRHADLINGKLDRLVKEKGELEQERTESKARNRGINTGKLEQEIRLYVRDFKKVLSRGLTGEKKAIMRSCIESIVSDPLKKEATISYYKLPKCPTTEPLFDLYLCPKSGATHRPR